MLDEGSILLISELVDLKNIYIPNKSTADPGSSLGSVSRSAVQPAAVVGSNQVGALLTVQSPMTLPTEILEAE